MCRLLSVLAFAVMASAASARNFPEKQITLIVPFAAGGTSDIIARIAADEMGQILNQRVVIENIGGAGVGSSNFLICRLFLQAAQVKAELIGYRGAGPALNDAMGGHVDGVCDAATSVAGSINGGKVHGLVIASRKRADILPNVPTAAEAGLPAFTNEGWNAIFAPAGTPDAVINVPNAALRKTVATEKVTRRLTELASFPASGEEFDPAYVKNFVEAEVKKYRELLAN